MNFESTKFIVKVSNYERVKSLKCSGETIMKINSFVFFVICSFVLCILLFPLVAKAQIFQSNLNVSNNSGGMEDIATLTQGNTIFVAWSDSTEGSYEIYFRRSTNGGYSWEAIQNLSQNTDTSRYAKIAVSGDNVYVVWGDYTTDFRQQNIKFRSSTNGGASFNSTQQLNQPSATLTCFPNVASNNNKVFVNWSDCAPAGTTGPFLRRSTDNGLNFNSLQIFSPSGINMRTAFSQGFVFLAYTNVNEIILRRSSDDGATFDITRTLPFGNEVEMIAADNNIYLIWQNSGIYFIRSANNGVNFENQINVAGNTQSFQGHLGVSGNHIVVSWVENVAGVDTLFFTRSLNYGASFEGRINISNNTSTAQNTRIFLKGTALYATWQEQISTTPFTVKVFFRGTSDLGETFGPKKTFVTTDVAALPEIGITGNSPYIFWKDFFIGGGDLFFSRTQPLPFNKFLLRKLLH